MIFVSPGSTKNFDNSFKSFKELSLKVIFLIGLFNKSLREAIFFTFILLNLLFSSDKDLMTVNINEFPSFKIFLLDSKVSENINNSNTLERSVNFNIA